MEEENVKYFNDVLCLEVDNILEVERLKKAYQFSKKAHEWQKRKSWQPYFIHPLAVWLSLWKRYKDVDLTIAWLLHDTVEDNDEIFMSEIYEKFGDNVWFIVDAVTKTEDKFYKNDDEIWDERDKMLYWWIRNIWAILVKLADREHNLATLKFMPSNKQVKKSFEAQALFLPLMEICWFDEKNITVDESGNRVKKFLKKNNIDNHIKLKHFLYNTCFNDFDDELFKLALNNTNIVVWEMEDKELFSELIKSGWFDAEWIKLISMVWNWKWYFKATFRISSWNNFKDIKNLKMSNVII